MLPLEVSTNLRKRLRDLGDRYGVVINSVPSRSAGLGSGGGGSGGGGGLPEYLCCPRVDTDDNTQDRRKVVQIWGLRNCVVGAFDRVVASLLDNLEYVVKLGPVDADERKRLRFKGKNVSPTRRIADQASSCWCLTPSWACTHAGSGMFRGIRTRKVYCYGMGRTTGQPYTLTDVEWLAG